jgi:sec-independent protein translocase protein TatA
MSALKPWHIIVLVVVLILLFGAKKLPDAARSLGRSMRIFKAETKGLMEDDVRAKAEAQTTRPVLAEDRLRDDEPSPLHPEPVHETRDDRR